MARSRHDAFPADPPVSFDGERAMREILEAMIRDMPPGALLPSERSIAQRFRVARMTVRRAVTDLAGRGLVRPVKGAGTFVAEPRLAHGTATGSFSRDMRERGLRPGARVISIRERPATALVADRLRIAEADPVVTLNRLRTADDVPMAVEQTHLPAARFGGLAELMTDDASLYAVLDQHWGVRVAAATHRVSAIGLDETDAALLDVPAGLPSFIVERTAYDAAGDVVEWGRSRYRGDRYDVVFDVTPA
jgi:GntR family transcriptional regulator